MSPKRDEFLKLFPKRVPVKPQMKVLEEQPTDYGSRKLIQYKVTSDEWVKAYLLYPSIKKKSTAAIIASHQHAGKYPLGKSEPAGLTSNKMYHYGVDLCKEGFIVICPDHLCFEERYASEIDRKEDVAPSDREYEAFIFADQLLKGSHLNAKYCFDLCQAIDVLEELPEVDSNNIGVFGHSLGGQTSMWLSFYDERIKAGFSSCGFGTLQSVQRDKIKHNFAAYLPGIFQVGDVNDVVPLIAPRAFGMSNGTKDRLFPMDGVEEIQKRANKSFPRGKYLPIVFDGPHQLPDSVKKKAYFFLKKHLNLKKK